MPGRIVREGILTSERVDALSWQAEVFYRRLMNVVDDFGRYYARPALVRAACFPLRLDRVSDSDIGKWIRETEEAGLVRAYQVEGKGYLELLDFHQQIRAKESKFPAPATGMHSGCVADATQMHSKGKASAPVVVVESVVVDDKRAASAAPPPEGVDPETWKAWVKQKGRKQTAEADRLQRKHLAEWREQGYDINRIVENAVASHWAGLHPPDDKKPNGKHAAGAWWESEQGILAKGKELDMTPYGGEGWPEFKARINQRLRAQSGSR